MRGGARGALVVAASLLVLAGCRGQTSKYPPIHPNPNMDDQPKLLAQESSDFFYDGAAMRLPVEGTVARGELRLDSDFYEGLDAGGTPVAANPLLASEQYRGGRSDEEIMARGAERYGIYCLPCHGATGDGESMLKERSGVASANLHDERIRQLPDGQMFDVVTNGLGLMSGYRYPIPADDRWAIIAYVRQLQEAGPEGAP